jgi:hypothetical protein
MRAEAAETRRAAIDETCRLLYLRRMQGMPRGLGLFVVAGAFCACGSNGSSGGADGSTASSASDAERDVVWAGANDFCGAGAFGCAMGTGKSFVLSCAEPNYCADAGGSLVEGASQENCQGTNVCCGNPWGGGRQGVSELGWRQLLGQQLREHPELRGRRGYGARRRHGGARARDWWDDAVADHKVPSVGAGAATPTIDDRLVAGSRVAGAPERPRPWNAQGDRCAHLHADLLTPR